MQLPLAPQTPARTHLDRARTLAAQIPSLTHPAGKKYAVRLLLAELKAALR